MRRLEASRPESILFVPEWFGIPSSGFGTFKTLSAPPLIIAEQLKQR
jgi:hypothetical protein